MNSLFLDNATLTILTKSLIAIIPAVGFAMLFNVPRKSLPWVAGAGFIAYLVRATSLHFGFTIELASFYAAVIMGFVTVWWSRKLLMPRPVFTVPAIIPMFPGSYSFKAMIAIVEISNHGYTHDLLDQAIQNGLQTLFVLGALCLGIALPSVLVFRQKPII